MTHVAYQKGGRAREQRRRSVRPSVEQRTGFPTGQTKINNNLKGPKGLTLLIRAVNYGLKPMTHALALIPNYIKHKLLLGPTYTTAAIHIMLYRYFVL